MGFKDTPNFYDGSAGRNPFVDKLLRPGSPSVTDFLNPLKNQTQGVNPASSLPPELARKIGPPLAHAGPVAAEAPKQNILEKLLGNPMLMNVMAQQGYSYTPGPSPVGVIGRAGLATANQQREDSRTALEDKLLRSRIGLNKAQTAAVGQPTAEDSKPLTDLAKLNDDFARGRMSQSDYDTRRNQILDSDIGSQFDRTSTLRGEFVQQTKGIQNSLQSLSSARSLASADNPTAQLAAFISTIKSIDNSTVREGELQAFRSIQALATKLDELKQKAGDGGFSPTLLEDIDSTITALEKPLTELLGKKQEFFRGEAERFKISPDSISGVPFSTVGPPTRDGSGGAGDPISDIDRQIAEIDAQLEKTNAN